MFPQASPCQFRPECDHQPLDPSAIHTRRIEVESVVEKVPLSSNIYSRLFNKLMTHSFIRKPSPDPNSMEIDQVPERTLSEQKVDQFQKLEKLRADFDLWLDSKHISDANRTNCIQGFKTLLNCVEECSKVKDKPQQPVPSERGEVPSASSE